MSVSRGHGNLRVLIARLGVICPEADHNEYKTDSVPTPPIRVNPSNPP